MLFPMLKYKNIFRIKYAEAILLNKYSETGMLEITKMLIAVKKINLLRYFLFIIFGTLC